MLSCKYTMWFFLTFVLQPHNLSNCELGMAVDDEINDNR